MTLLDLAATIEIGGRTYRKFIPYPRPVNDGTCRCIQCGQIDELEYHDSELCAAALRARAQIEGQEA